MSGLASLTAEEFRDELNESLFDDDLWREFLSEEVVERTRVELVSISAHVRSQIASRRDEGDSVWRRRAANFLRKVDARCAEAKSAMRAVNRARTASVAAYEMKWAAFAFDLAVALDHSDMATMLDEIMLPPGEITAGEWLDARRAQRAGRQAREVALR